MTRFFVIDTNNLVSAALVGGTSPARAMDKAVSAGKLAFSDATFHEFKEVLFRKKFDKYFTDSEERWRIINHIQFNSVFFSPAESITDCRDPKDNKFLELAVTAEASCIITGDKDLLELHPFRGVSVLSPADFLTFEP